MRRGAAASAMKLERRGLLDYIATHEDFEKEVLDAESEANEHVEEALYQAAVSGSVPACKLWIDLRRQGSGNLPAVVEGTDDFDGLVELSMD